LHRRPYQSIFGRYELERTVYGSREGQKIEFVPLDQRLGLPDNDFSYLLQDWTQALGVEQAFGRVSQTLEMILGFGQSVDSLERINRHMARSVQGYRESRPAPPADQEGAIVVVSADGKGIPMRRPAEARPVGAHRKKGEKANKKQMATVGAVYTVDPKRRAAEEVVAALFREGPAPASSSPPPEAQHKRVWSSLTLERQGDLCRGEEAVFAWLAEEQARRNPEALKEIVCLMDGQPSLWQDRRRYLPLERVVEILDVLHVTPRLWEAAHLFHPEGSEEAAAFVRVRLLSILQGRVGYVIGGLRQMGTKQKRRGRKLRSLRRICAYLKKNQNRMRYDEYLAAGYPIASGVIEGACRYVVKDRMERAGMRWSVVGAQAMLDLRTTYVNGQWQEFQQYRIEQETTRLYPYQDALDRAEWPLAA
jgi:PAS domain-containing protein